MPLTNLPAVSESLTEAGKSSLPLAIAEASTRLRVAKNRAEVLLEVCGDSTVIALPGSQWMIGLCTRARASSVQTSSSSLALNAPAWAQNSFCGLKGQGKPVTCRPKHHNAQKVRLQILKGFQLKANGVWKCDLAMEH